MSTTAFPRRRTAPDTALLATVIAAVTALLIGTFAQPVSAQETDDEGGTRSLREALDEASTAYQDAEVELEESEKRELKILVQLEELGEERERLVEAVQLTAATAYRSGRVGPLTALLNSGSTNSFLDRVSLVERIAKREDEQLAALREITEELEERHEELAAEVERQEAILAERAEALDQAESALFAIGGGASGSFEAYASEDASPAPRNSDGSWPSESCSESDPTTSGCLTPRTLHALQEAQLFGFTRYTSCWRQGSFGEHPLGRACDFAAAASGFGGAATGADKEYGDRVASFFVHNADALGVQYVIWYYQIWFPGSGWRSYGGAAGDPASDHTNHVHVSIR